VQDGSLDTAVFIQGNVGTAEAVPVPDPITVDPEPVPEPMTMGGLMAGGAMLAAGRKLRARRP